MAGPEPGQSWGILGGVFDPVHRGHLILAEQVRSLSRLNGILFIPACKTPHRQLSQGASFKQRACMLILALTDYPTFDLDTLEQDQHLSGYSLDTVRILKKRYPKVDFQFIIGADNLASFKTWHRWEDVLKEIRLLVGCRPGSKPVDLGDFPEGRVQLFETQLVDLSSTAVREAVQAGVTKERLAQMVPDRVAEYIVKEGLYQ